MAKEKIMTIRQYILAIQELIKNEKDGRKQSNLALECIEQITLKAGKYLSAEARSDALQNITGLLSVVQGQVLPNHAGQGQVFPNYAGEGQVLSNYAGEGQVFPNYAGEGQVFPNFAGEGQVFPNYAGEGQVLSNYAEEGQVFPNFAGEGQVFPNYAGDGQVLPNYAGEGQVLPSYVGEGQVLPNHTEEESPVSLDHDSNDVSNEEMALASRNTQSPRTNAQITFELSSLVGIDHLVYLRGTFFLELTLIKVKPLGLEVTKSLEYTASQAEDLTNLIFYDVLNAPMKYRVMNIIQSYTNGSRASVDQEDVTLYFRSDLPVPLREFSTLFDARSVIRSGSSLMHGIKKTLCEILLFRKYQEIQSCILNEDPGMLATFAETGIRCHIKSCKKFTATLFDISQTTFDHDITQCQILAELCDVFGYGIILFLPKNVGQLLARNYRCPRLNAAWPVLKKIIPDLERITNMACQNVLCPIIYNKEVRVAVPNANTNSAESLFKPLKDDFFDYSKYLEDIDNEPEDKLTEAAIIKFVLEGMTVKENGAEPDPMEA